jgi:hypothetical protein
VKTLRGFDAARDWRWAEEKLDDAVRRAMLMAASEYTLMARGWRR